MKRTIIRFIGLVGLIALVASSPANLAGFPSKIKLGLIFGLTGAASPIGPGLASKA